MSDETVQQAEEFVDGMDHQAQRTALIDVIDALASLDREAAIKIIKCAKQFYGLPSID